MVDDFVPGQRRRTGHAAGFEAIHPFAGGAFEQDLLGQFEPCVDICGARRRRGEAVVGQPVRPVQRRTQAAPFLVGHHGDRHVAVRRLVDQVDDAGRRLVGNVGAGPGLRVEVRGPEEGQDGIQHRQADMLARARALAAKQGGADRLRRGDRGQFVGQDGAHQPRALLVGAGLDGRQAAERLDHRIVDRLVRPRAFLAEAGDRQVDDPRIDRRDVIVADAESLDHAGAEVLHEDIGCPGDLQQQVAAAGLLEVDGNRALVAVDVEERRRQAAAPVAERAGMVAPARRLDLDHVGALVAQDRGRPRPRQHRAQVDDPNTLIRSAHVHRSFRTGPLSRKIVLPPRQTGNGIPG